MLWRKSHKSRQAYRLPTSVTRNQHPIETYRICFPQQQPLTIPMTLLDHWLVLNVAPIHSGVVYASREASPLVAVSDMPNRWSHLVTFVSLRKVLFVWKCIWKKNGYRFTFKSHRLPIGESLVVIEPKMAGYNVAPESETRVSRKTKIYISQQFWKILIFDNSTLENRKFQIQLVMVCWARTLRSMWLHTTFKTSFQCLSLKSMI